MFTADNQVLTWNIKMITRLNDDFIVQYQLRVLKKNPHRDVKYLGESACPFSSYSGACSRRIKLVQWSELHVK